MRRNQKQRTALSPSTRRLVSIMAVLLAVCCGLSVSAAAALAAPGTTVETAGLLTPGVTVSGDTASERVIGHGLSSVPACTKDEQLWAVNLIAGDKVTLHGAEEAPAEGFVVEAVPPGTSDATLLGTASIRGVDEGSLEGGLTFTAPRTGTWVIIVGPSCDGRDGPYRLSAKLIPVLPRLTSLVFPARVLGTGRAATLRLTLSEPGTVRVPVRQILTGRRLHGSCSQHARRGRSCSLAIHRTTFTFAGAKRPTGSTEGERAQSAKRTNSPSVSATRSLRPRGCSRRLAVVAQVGSQGIHRSALGK
jgi:hypothetical protein